MPIAAFSRRHWILFWYLRLQVDYNWFTSSKMGEYAPNLSGKRWSRKKPKILYQGILCWHRKTIRGPLTLPSARHFCRPSRLPERAPVCPAALGGRADTGLGQVTGGSVWRRTRPELAGGVLRGRRESARCGPAGVPALCRARGWSGRRQATTERLPTPRCVWFRGWVASSAPFWPWRFYSALSVSIHLGCISGRSAETRYARYAF